MFCVFRTRVVNLRRIQATRRHGVPDGGESVGSVRHVRTSAGGRVPQHVGRASDPAVIAKLRHAYLETRDTGSGSPDCELVATARSSLLLW